MRWWTFTLKLSFALVALCPVLKITFLSWTYNFYSFTLLLNYCHLWKYLYGYILSCNKYHTVFKFQPYSQKWIIGCGCTEYFQTLCVLIHSYECDNQPLNSPPPGYTSIITFASMWPLTTKLPTTSNTVPPQQRSAARKTAFQGTACAGISN